jgi:hypothetical protein
VKLSLYTTLFLYLCIRKKNRFMNKLAIFVAVALSTFASAGCTAHKDFLRVDGGRIVNDNGEVLLRGMGLGGWVLQEPYMMHLPGGMHTQTQLRDSLVALVGETRTARFYRAWWTNGIQKRDIDSLAAWGFNHVRMPMHYNIYTLPIDQEPVAGEHTWLDHGFAITDSLLSWCAANRIYLFLDLHAAPGGQGNDVAISDASPVKLWQDDRNVEKAVALWRRLAERYKNEEWIGGYDIINEPNWGFTDPEGDRNGTGEQNNAPLRDYFMRVTRAIRQVDTRHMIVIEGNGWGNNYNGVWPLDWDSNTVISFHRYWNYNTQETLDGALENRTTQNAPLWMSESGENSNVWFTDAISLLEANNIGWCWWTYKRMGTGTPMQIVPGEGYLRMLDYWAGRGPRPSADEAWAALTTLAENYKQENTLFHRDYIDALFRQVRTTDTAPWTRHTLDTGTLTIFASDYDLGREGHAYHDTDVANYRTSGGPQGGNSGHAYRNDGVDIFAGNAPGGNGYHVGRTEQGEWLKYTLEVAAAGDYTLSVCESTDGTKWTIRQAGIVTLAAGTVPFIYNIEKPGINVAWFRLTPVMP